MNNRSFSVVGRPVTVALAAWLGVVASPVIAQQENPVYVDDSPQAWQLFRRAADQARENTAESVRLYQELLDEFAFKLIPMTPNDQDFFASTRTRVLRTLQSDARVLERYRQMQTPQAQQLLEGGELERLARTRSLTEPGLEALLRLAQENLESAKFHFALGWIDEALTHQDLNGRRAAHAHYMAGLARHNLGHDALARQELDALAHLGDDGQVFHDQLQALLQPKDLPTIVRGISTLQRSVASDLNELVAHDVWSQPLEESLLRQRYRNPDFEDEQFRGTLQQRVQEADLATTIATATADTVFVNQGNVVLSFNRLTGRRNWSHTDQPRGGNPARDGEQPLDMSVVAVHGDALVTLTGHANAASRSGRGKVICLDASTGRLRWSNELRSLAGTLSGVGGEEDLFPHGAPIIADGTVFVAARRVSQQLLTSAYVVALDLETGQIRWSQYVTSSGGLRASPRPYCSLVWDAGDLFVASPVGAILRVNASNGDIRWLRRYNVPLSQPIMDQGRRPWELTAPVITRRGVLAIEPDQRRIILLDRETGHPLESFSATSSDGWYSPRYLLADDHRVYGIGVEIRAFNLDALESPAWRLPAQVMQESAPNEPAPPVEPLQIRGRVQLVEGALIVPAAAGVLVVDDETGQVRHRLNVENPGHPLAVDAQLILAGADRVDSYMSFDRAERMLRDRIAQAPTEPEPALSLLRLGMKVRSLPLSLESANLVLQAIDRMPSSAVSGDGVRRPGDARAELFDLLLGLAAAGIAQSAEQSESVYAVINSVAIEPGQRVEYLLRYGDWLAEQSLSRSVETYQTILSDTVLAMTWRSIAGISRPSSEWAIDHLQALMAKHGATAYATQADFAQRRLHQVQAAPDPVALVNLAREFPFAPAAVEASIAAAHNYADNDSPRDALAALAPMIALHLRQPQSQSHLARLLGAHAGIAERAGWTSQASAALIMAVRTGLNQPLIDQGGPRDPHDWLRALTGRTSAAPMYATIGDSVGTAEVINGTVVPMHEHADSEPPLDRALLRDGSMLKLMPAAGNQPIWSSTIETDLPELLRMDAQRIVIWMGADPEDPKAMLFDATNGSLLWTTPRLSTLLPSDAVRDLGRLRGAQNLMPDGEPFEASQTLPLINGQSLVLVQRTGAVVCFDLPSRPLQPPAEAQQGVGTVRWTLPHTLDQIHLARLTDIGLVLVGRQLSTSDSDDRAGGRNSNERGPRREGSFTPLIMVLDPRSGEPVYGTDSAMIKPLGRSGVKWMHIDPRGRMILATAEGLEAIDLLSGRSLWTNTGHAALDSQHGWGRDERLVIEDRRARLRIVNLANGAVSEQFEIPLRSEWDPTDLRSVTLTSDRAIVHYRQRIVMYDFQGNLVGNDKVTDDREYRWLRIGKDRLLAISGRSEQVPIADQGGRRTQHVYRIYSMSENGRALSEPWVLDPPLPERVQHTLLLNGRLLLSTQSVTVAVPMEQATPK